MLANILGPRLGQLVEAVAMTTVGLGGDNQEKQLTKQDGDQDPSWSPDGKQITFKRQDQVWIMNADGSDAHRITKPGDVGTAAAWSPR